MTAPIDRDRQIELMRTAEERIRASLAAWKKIPQVREALSRPAPGQEVRGYTVRQVKLKVGAC